MAVPNTQHMQSLLYLVPALAVLGLIVMAIQSAWVRKQDTGSARMSEIAQHIHEGALAFLSAEYRILAIFVVVAGALLGLVSAMVETTHWFIVVAFVIGAVFSALAGHHLWCASREQLLRDCGEDVCYGQRHSQCQRKQASCDCTYTFIPRFFSSKHA